MPPPAVQSFGHTRTRRPAMTDGMNIRIQNPSAKTARLSREEERELVARLQGGDASAATRLVSSHLAFVVHIAKRYRDQGQPFADLVQEGNVGLLEALPRFNPEREVGSTSGWER